MKLVYSQKSKQKWKKLAMQKNSLSMAAIERECYTQCFVMSFLLLDSTATEAGGEVCGHA